MKLSPEQIHQRHYLTQNFLHRGDDGLIFKNEDLWIYVIHVVITTAPGPFAPNSGPANFVGHFKLESAPFALQEFTPERQAYEQEKCAKFIAELAANESWNPITQVPRAHLVP